MKQKDCLIKECDNRNWIEGRGLCTIHYLRSQRAIKSGKTTWKKLIALGLASPTKLEVWKMYDQKMERARIKKEQEQL